ncbi:MAG TPA: AAA family ATPase, partial [Longimicrobiales bacterium]|nr:AAA family ATPase [Longimicrobiales bacterium]
MPVPTLPTPPTPLIGRADQLAELEVLLGDPSVRLITLVGPPGVGKTRLALQLVADRRSGYADGVWFVPLASLEDPDLVVPAIATALQLSTARSDPRAVVEAHLRERRMLLMLDNFEQVLGAAPDLAELLRAC